jgi:putative colanic acid biosynthesis UDP-glucose lipid carrier transferase
MRCSTLNSIPNLDGWASRALRANNDILAHHSFLTGILYRVVDLLAVIAAAAVASLIRSPDTAWLPYQITILIALLLVIIVFDRFELYAPWRGRSLVDQVGRLALAWVTVFALLISSAFLMKLSANFSRGWVTAWFATGFMTLSIARAGTLFALRSLRSRGWNHKQVVIVGAGQWAREIAKRVQSTDWLGFDIKCFVDSEPERWRHEMNGFKLAGHYDLLPGILAEGDVDEVWICMPLHVRERQGIDHVEKVRELLRDDMVNQRIVPDIAELRIFEKPMTEIAGIPFINLTTSPHQGINRITKLIEDYVLGSVILILAAPLMLVIAALIKLTSPGPVFFTQLRHGWDGKPFNVFKFRTMYAHYVNEGEVEQARREDARVTPLGRLLRSTSLDELPQFFNVLKGDMSIVGPRPHAMEHNEMYKDLIDSFMQRHRVKPGITGWAQVNGWRGGTDTVDQMRGRIELDLYYIEHWSLTFDIKILFLTLIRGFLHKNAY